MEAGKGDAGQILASAQLEAHNAGIKAAAYCADRRTNSTGCARSEYVVRHETMNVLRKTILLLPPLWIGFGMVAYAQDQTKTPNIVFMFADDLGYGDLACYGHPYARTPALDRLASEGTRFTRFYVSGVTCCPSRTGFMTGLHAARFPNYPAGFGFSGQVTVSELLKKQGYRIGHFGKWHIGPGRFSKRSFGAGLAANALCDRRS